MLIPACDKSFLLCNVEKLLHRSYYRPVWEIFEIWEGGLNILALRKVRSALHSSQKDSFPIGNLVHQLAPTGYNCPPSQLMKAPHMLSLWRLFISWDSFAQFLAIALADWPWSDGLTVGRFYRRSLPDSNFYMLPSCSPGHAISKTVPWASVTPFLPVVVNFEG